MCGIRMAFEFYFSRLCLLSVVGACQCVLDEMHAFIECHDTC